ncbi:MAG: FecR domain-containing protein [Planctomycetes bacterium]|nr:FecR domain-containing protein [Planctomycetota bacterium]
MSTLPPEPRPPDAPLLNCDEARRLFETLLEEGSLTDSEQRLLQLHLKPCPACRGEFERLRALEARMRRVLSGLDTAPEFSAKVVAALPVAGEPDAPAWLEARASRPRLADLAEAAGAGRSRRVGLWLRRVRVYAVFLFVALTIGAGLLGAYLRHGILGDPADAGCIAVDVQGAGTVRHRERDETLRTGGVLQPGDLITAQVGSADPRLTVRLQSAMRTLADVHLKPGAQLLVRNRHHFELTQGEAYFEVRKDRPGAADESFVVETPLGQVEVVGTVFGVQVPAREPQAVTVVVDEGTVRLRPLSGSPSLLLAAHEADLVQGGVSSVRPIGATQLAWVRAGVRVSGTPVAQHPAPQDPAPSDVRPAALPPLDWSRPVAGLDLRGLSCAEAFARLARSLESPPALLELAAAAEGLGPAERRSTLAIHDTLALSAAVRWLARDFGLRFDEASRRLRAAEPAELPGPTASGVWSPELLERAGAPLPLAAQPAGPRTLEKLCAELSERSGVNLWIDTRDAPEGAREWPASPDDRPSLVAALNAALRAAGLEVCVYDGLLYVAAPERVEALTNVERFAVVDAWLPQDAPDAWTRDFEAWARAIGESRAGWNLNGQALFADARVEREGARLHFSGGLRAERAMDRALAALRQPAAAPAALAEELYSLREAGHVRDLQALAARAAEAEIEIAVPEGKGAFPQQAFFCKSLPLSRVLEWGARLHGMGLRREGRRIVVDESKACYGPARMQVLDLSALARLAPNQSDLLPHALAGQIRMWFPELFRDADFYGFRERLVFQGDAERLAAAMRVMRELEHALRAAPDPNAFDLKGWQPEWRRELDASLKLPFRSETGGMPAGATFRQWLRSGRFAALHASVLVDPASMERLAAKQMPELATREKSLGEVLHELAGAAGLRVVVEDEAIWLRP